MKKTNIAALIAAGVCCGFCGIKLQDKTAFAEIYKETAAPIMVSNEENGENSLQIRAKSAYLMDFASSSPIYTQNEKTHLPIASMCKIMTLILTFDAIDNGIIDMEEEITVSEKAASMGGSQVFLEANAKYKVKELIKSIVVCSANDSCVALAEKICGSESVFTDKMNVKAKELGANDTLFANCTGLPKEPQYSCAKDVAIMLKELLNHQEYFEFGKVWMDKFSHPKGRYTEISNTNKLVRFYEGCDGGKTGFTNQAGFCLAATAKRGDMRIISVIIGSENSANRFEDTKTMFNYAFANYTVKPVLEANVPLENTVKVNGGKEKELAVVPARPSFVFCKKGEKPNVTIETCYNAISAPVKKGETVGEIFIYKDGVEIDKVPLIAEHDIEKANLFDRWREVARGWNARNN